MHAFSAIPDAVRRKVHHSPTSRWLRYGSALGSVALASLIRFSLNPWLGHHSIFLLLLPAILFSVWFGGLGPGLVAIGAGTVISAWLFLPPRHGLVIDDPGEPLTLLLFVLAGLFVTLLNTAQQEAQTRAEASARLANEQRAQIEDLNRRLSQAMVESNHRIKNNLQVVSALLALHSMEGRDSIPVDALARIQQHVHALAALHDLLTIEAKESPEDSLISLRAVLGKVMPMIQAAVGGRKIVYRSDDVSVRSNKGAIICLLLNELVSNAIKHGAQEVGVVVTRTEKLVCLEVSDDGPGFPSGFDPRSAAHTGLELVESIGRHDLGGAVVFENRPGGGARVSVTFPTVPA